MPDAIEQRLAELAHDLRVDVPAGLADSVMDRVHGARPARRWRRWVVGLLLGALAGGVVASPVGATLREWFGFHGVAVTSGDRVTSSPTVPAASGGADLAEAAALAGFEPVVPDALGAPDAVEVSDDASVVSLSWTTDDGTVRLDEFLGTVEPLFWKTAPEAEHVAVAGRDALWLPTPHRVTVLAPGGDVRQLPSRLSAPTLVWLSGDLTLRLEGDLGLDEAVAVAESVDTGTSP
ncbi:hypothetical protein ASC64_06515 [Nocardioides sp. Root122]|uniref:hypothetical protein n=1 Tax=Nocardioides TaxID=1839 RepID=UPI000702F590|nr:MULTISPECIES: hypothetical protein [Nocardioides]KQV69496.1 hypothetical protein ASC64_06515 [Nocardioides sp. Root122]MCK9824272.1 hypothetical protein [Nocardioides cavernae]